MKIITKLIVSCAIFSVLTGCASIAGDNTRSVHVSSIPSGAGIYVDNQQYGVTPAAVTLPNDIYGGKTITLRKKGYQDQSLAVNTKFQPVAVLDVLFWPSIIIDAATGNLVKIDPANRALHSTMARA